MESNTFLHAESNPGSSKLDKKKSLKSETDKVH